MNAAAEVEDRNDTGEDHPSFDLLKIWYRRAYDANREQIEREREALRFQIPDLQWTDEAIKERNGDPSRGIPARPRLSVSKIDQPIRQITNQMRNAHLGIQLHPLSPDADDDTAEVLQGLYRSIERDSNASEARSFAFDRATKCGRGYYRVIGCYDESAPDDGPEAFDQVPRIQRILYQDEVLFDPAAMLADFSDAGHVFVGAWVSVQELRRLYPDAEAVKGLEDGDLEDFPEPEWVRADGDKVALRVVECLYKLHETERIEYGAGKDKVTRFRDKVRVYSVKLCGSGFLEEPQPTNGQYLPVVAVLGRELQPFDGKRRWDGIIQPNMGAQRGYNFALTSAIEAAALEPKAPFIGYAGQFEGHPEWEQANVRAFPYLEANPVVDGTTNQVLPLPMRAQVDGSRMQLSAMLAQSMEAAIQSGTMMFDPSLGRSNGSERSGKAITALQQQGNEATSDLLANFADNSLRYEAKVILDLIPSLYDRAGRIARILDEEDNTSAVMLGRPFVVDPNTKRPMPANDNQPNAKNYDLAKGRYAIAVSVGRSRQTKMEAGAEEIGQLLQAHPELFVALGDLYLRFRDYPGAREMADRMSALREMRMPGIGADKDKPASPEQMRAENARLKMELQRLQQGLQQLQQEVANDNAKQQATVVKAQIDGQTKVQTAQIDADAKLQIAEMQAQLKAITDRLDRSHEDRQGDKDVHRDVAREAGKAMFAPLDLSAKAGSIGRPLSAPKGEV